VYAAASSEEEDEEEDVEAQNSAALGALNKM
jgi:hypothetical protein